MYSETDANAETPYNVSSTFVCKKYPCRNCLTLLDEVLCKKTRIAYTSSFRIQFNIERGGREKRNRKIKLDLLLSPTSASTDETFLEEAHTDTNCANTYVIGLRVPC